MKRFVYTEAEPALHRFRGQPVLIPVKRETVVYYRVDGNHHTTRPYHPSKYPASRYSKTVFARREAQP